MRTRLIPVVGLIAFAGACDRTSPTTALDPPGAAVTPARPGVLLFGSAVDDPLEDIYRVGVDGSDVVRLTVNTNVYDGEARFSPDGRRIVFASSRNDMTGGYSRDLFLMDANGSNVVQLTSGPSDDFFPRWSPNGKRIVFGRDDPATPAFAGDIFVINADGSGETRLTNHPAHEGGGVWSPNGHQFVFFRGRHTYIMDDDGGNVVQLTDDAQSDFPTDWSASGRILLNRRVASGTWDVFVMNADGSGLQQVTTDPGQDLFAVFSVDGHWIAVQSDRAGPALYPHIWIMRLDGSDPTQVTTSSSYEVLPDWRPGI